MHRACVRHACARAGGFAHDAIGNHALEAHDQHVGVVEGSRPGEVRVIVLTFHRGHEGLQEVRQPQHVACSVLVPHCKEVTPRPPRMAHLCKRAGSH